MIPGIDVSEYQGYVDWNQVHMAGFKFAMPKATEGLGFKDSTFPHNWQSLKYRGMYRIAYHLLHPSLDGAKQADYFHGYVRDCGRFSAGDAVMLDLEVTDGQSTQQVIRCAEAFVQRCWTQINKPVILYTGPWFYDGVLGGPRSLILGRCPLAQAQYGPNLTPLEQWPTGASFWQFSATGRVAGIVGDCDMDYFLGDMRQLHLVMSVIPHH